MAINFNRVEFVLSAASEKQFVRDGMPQLAFAGRSNVGKSSVINRIVNRKNFARVGASPGKTSQINYFKIDGKLYLVDLPGYGYAKVSKAERDRWGKLMEDYFQSAGLIHLGVQIVDARHKPTADDVTMHDYFVQTGCPVVIVANKLDKLKAREVEPNLAKIRETLNLRDDEIIVPFSAEKGTGKEQLINAILDHLNGLKGIILHRKASVWNDHTEAFYRISWEITCAVSGVRCSGRKTQTSARGIVSGARRRRSKFHPRPIHCPPRFGTLRARHGCGRRRRR